MEKNDGLKMTKKIPFHIYVIAAAVTLLAGLFFAATFKSYRSEVTLMLIARTDYSVADKREIAGNLAELPKLLSFYNLLLKDNSDVVDLNADMSAAKRKAAWNNVLKSENVNNGGSSLIFLSATMPTESGAKTVAQKSADTLVAVTGRYYDISKDIDLRIVDGPVTEKVVSSWLFVSLLSLACGSVVLIMSPYFSAPRFPKFSFGKKRYSFVALHNIRDIFSKKETESKNVEEGKKELESIYSAEESFDADVMQTYEAKKETRGQAPANLPVFGLSEQYPNFPEMPISHGKTANAPANLPFADDELFASRTGTTNAGHPNQHSESEIKEFPESGVQEEAKEIAMAEVPGEERDVPVEHEPSPEDLKKRLNQLLKGEL